MKKAVFIIALLVPMMLSAQLLMYLNRPVPRGGGVVSYTNDVTYFYGDSITAGYLISNPSNRFSSLLCAQLSMVESNVAVGGTEIADSGESDVITADTSIYSTNISVWLAGYNDMRFYGTNAAALNDNLDALESLTAWLALQTYQRVTWDSPGITYTGGWFNNTALGGLAYSTEAADTATFNFSGTTLLIGSARAGSAGNALVVVDGTVSNLYSCQRNSVPTGLGRSYSAGLIVFTNLPNTTHTAVFTAQSTNSTYLCWYAGYATNQLPKVVLCGTLHIPAQGVLVGPPYTNGSDMAADLYSGVLSNTAATLSNAKLNVTWVPAPVLYLSDWNASDYVHPNESGHVIIKSSISLIL